MSINPKSVLMVAYYFPPEGNAAVYRPLRFINELVTNGWNATVICCEPYQYERYDPRLLDQVPQGTTVVQVKGRDPWRAFQTWRGTRFDRKLASLSNEGAKKLEAGLYAPWRSKFREAVRVAEAWVYRPDIAMPWIRPAVRQAQDVCRRIRPDVIWSTIGPLSSGVVAYRTSLATEIPYVLDFRDPWGLEYYPEERRRPAWAKKIDNTIISRMFERAQAVVFLFESVAESYVRAFPGALDSKKIHIIPNGFEGTVEEFVHVPGDHCTVLYAGTLSGYRYDTLLEGLVQLKHKEPQRAAQLRLRFVGEGLQELSGRLADLDLRDLVEIFPPVSHTEVRRLQQESHALLVLGRSSGRKGHELVAGAKLFGYLQAGRPIIGIVPRDETRRILAQIESPLIADVDTPAHVVAVFEQILTAWSERTLDRLVPNRAACEAYSSSRQVSSLISALCGTHPERGSPKEPAKSAPSLHPEVGS